MTKDELPPLIVGTGRIDRERGGGRGGERETKTEGEKDEQEQQEMRRMTMIVFNTQNCLNVDYGSRLCLSMESC